MCLGMANGYRVPEKENVNESAEISEQETIRALECCASNGAMVCNISECPLFGTKCDVLLAKESLALINRYKTANQKLKKRVEDLKRKLAKSPENRFACCVSVEYGEIYTKSLADYDKLLNGIKKCLIEDFERAYKARKLVITHEPVRYVRIPLSMFEKLVEEKIKTPEIHYKQQKKLSESSLSIEEGTRIYDKIINTFLGGEGI